MYKQLTKSDFLKQFRMQEEDIPEALIIYGEWDAGKIVRCWRESICPLDQLIAPDVFVGRCDNGTRYGLSVTYGSAKTSQLVHTFSLLGVKLVLQVGSFGGLLPGRHVGHLLFPTEAFRGEGASDFYLGLGEKAAASQPIVEWLCAQGQSRQIECSTGEIMTINAMLGERWEDVQRWSKEGYAGVDLETATTYAVAKHFNVPRAGILYLADNLIEGRGLHAVSSTEKEIKAAARLTVSRLAVEAVSRWAAADAAG